MHTELNYIVTIKPIDHINILSKFTKTDNDIIKDCIKTISAMTKEERYKVIEKAYLEIFRWIDIHCEDNIDIEEKLAEILVSFIRSENVSNDIKDRISSFILTEGLHNHIPILDRADYKTVLNLKEDRMCFDKVYINRFNETYQ